MLWNWIAYHARQRPDASAVTLPGRKVGYARFAVDIARTTEVLREDLPASAKLVAVNIKHPYLRWLAVLALSRLGLTSTNPSAIEDCGADALVLDAPSGSTIPTALVRNEWVKGDLDLSLLSARDPDADFPIRMIASSGTTGVPKRVLIGASVLQRRAFNMAPCYGLDRNCRMVTNMGAGTVGGFTVPAGVWVAGGTLLLHDDPWFAPDLEESQRPNVALISTGYLDHLLLQHGERSTPLSNTRFLIGGGAVTPYVLERARRILSPSVSIIYASTETGLVAADSRTGQPITPQAVGVIVPGVDVEIVDEAGAALPPGSSGEVRVRSPTVVDGYLDDPEATARHFRDGWFHPGDVGMFGDDGMLYVTGRTNELLNLGGQKVAPIVIEDVALRCPGVVDAGACSVRDSSSDIVVVAVSTSEGYARENLSKALRERFTNYRIAIGEVAAIPRNEMGKIARSELIELVRAHAKGGINPPG